MKRVLLSRGRCIAAGARQCLFLSIALCTLAGCASTIMIGQWQATAPQPAFRKLLVVGATHGGKLRLVLENEMVRALAARGVEAVASHTLVADDNPSASAIAEAASRSAADGVLSTRVVQVDQHVEAFLPGPAYFGPQWGFYQPPGAAWGPPYLYPTQPIGWEIIYAQTSLSRAGHDAPVWAATTESYGAVDTPREAAAFAQLILRELAVKHLI